MISAARGQPAEARTRWDDVRGNLGEWHPRGERASRWSASINTTGARQRPHAEARDCTGSAIGSLAGWDQIENVLKRLPKEERWTHFWAKEGTYQQVDYLLVSKALAGRVAGLPEVERRGMPKRAERVERRRFRGVGENRPKASDHCPVTVEVVVQK